MDTYEIPLFPLDTVLFPGMPLPLHIFEDRYKQMIRFCLAEERPFGVVLIRQGVAERGPLPDPHEVGCTALITQVQNLNEGRLFIMAVGQDRFRIRRVKQEHAYLTGVVEALTFSAESPDQLATGATQLFPYVVDYLDILARLGRVEFSEEQIPQEAETLVYLAASLVQLPVAEKQALLATTRQTYMLRRLRQLYSEQLQLMRFMPADNDEPFSLN